LELKASVNLKRWLSCR